MKRRNKIVVKAFTLSECLVVMLVGGLIFLGVTEGLGLFMGYTSSRTNILQYEQQVYDDLMILNGLLAECDSINTAPERFSVFNGGDETVLSCADERIVMRREMFSDTLLYRNRAVMEIMDNPDDKEGLPGVKIIFEMEIEGAVTMEYLPRLSRPAYLAKSIRETEEGFDYE